MFDWVLAIPLWFSNAPAQDQDYVGVVAAEAAYSALLVDQAPVKPKVPTKDCVTCRGSGRVRTGDDQGWTKCPDCDPTLGTESAEVILAPSVIEKEPAPQTPAGFPPRPLPSVQ